MKDKDEQTILYIGGQCGSLCFTYFADMLEEDLEAPRWYQSLKKGLMDVVREEILKVKAVDASRHMHDNFRALNGLPICFFCKRLGHVKKYCKRRLFNVNQNQNSTEISPTFSKPNEEMVSQVDEAQHAVLLETEIEDGFAAVTKLLNRMRSIADEVAKIIETRRTVTTLSKDEHEGDNVIFRQGFLQIVSKISDVSMSLDHKLDEQRPNMTACKVRPDSSFMFAIPHRRNESQATQIYGNPIT